jgi:hypothetical protein
MSSLVSQTYRSPRPTTSNGRANLFPTEVDDPSIGLILSVDSELIARAVGLSCSAGMALMFSPTSQGTAVGVHLWYGSTRDKRYATSTDGFRRLLEAVCDIAEAKLAGDPAAGLKVLPERS